MLICRPNLIKSNKFFQVKQISQIIFRLCSNDTIYSQLHPHIDFEEYLTNIDHLKENIKLRNLSNNLDEIIDLWKFSRSLKDKKFKIDETKLDLTNDIKSLMNERQTDDVIKKIDTLKLKGRMIREELNCLTAALNSLNNKLIPKLLSLPNSLHKNSKNVGKTIFQSQNFDINPDNSRRLNNSLNDKFEYKNNFNIYLLDELAEFEITLPSYVAGMMKDNFIQFSNPDCTRNIILEGCGISKNVVMELEGNYGNTIDDKLYLHGGASVLSFLSYHCKRIVNFTNLPLRYLSKGRNYSIKATSDDLYDSTQSNCVQIFVGTSDNNLTEEFDKTVNTVKGIYEKFDLPLKIKYANVEDLDISESLRVDYQLYSPFNDKFKTIGSLSLHGDYFSKRLRIYYNLEGNLKFLNIFSGNIISVMPLLAILNEYDVDVFLKISKLVNNYL